MIGNQNARKHHITKETLESLYVTEGLSVREIEERLKCRTIHRLLVKYKISRRQVNRPRSIPPVSPTATDKAYAAGFFDGEGSINIRLPVRRSGYRLVVSVAQTRIAPLEWLCQRWGGKVTPIKRTNPTWSWSLCSQQAGAFLSDVLGFLIVKRAEADIAVAFQKRKRNCGRSATAEDRASDEESRNHLHSLR